MTPADTAGMPPSRFALSDLVITLQRPAPTGGCWPRCPEYTVELRGTGEVHFEGGAYVADAGPHTIEIEPRVVFGVLEEFYRMDFFGLRASYMSYPTVHLSTTGEVSTGTGFITDIPDAAITIRIGSFGKTVTWQLPLLLSQGRRGNQELTRLGTLIDSVAGTRKWVGGR